MDAIFWPVKAHGGVTVTIYDGYMVTKFAPTLIIGSSEFADKLAPELVGKISLVVTSPPYHNAISYSSHQEDREANYRVRSKIDYEGEYLSLMYRVWNSCWQMLEPGGYLAVNVGSVLDAGFHFPLPQDIERQLSNAEVPWEFYRTIVWHKVTAGVKRAGSVIQHKLPGYWYPNIMTEHILIFRKPGRKKKINKDVPPEWLENFWDLAPVPPRTIDHPAPFPEDLPHRLIRMLTKPEDWVLDPFNGAGSTTKAAYDLGRKSVGFDLSRQYVQYAKKRIKRPSSVRTSQLLVIPVDSKDFTAGKSRGKTRHGAGRGANKNVE